MRVRAQFSLGLRLAMTPGYGPRSRAVLLALTVLVVTFLALAAAAASNVESAVEQRAESRLRVGGDLKSATSWVSEPTEDRLWNGHTLSRLYLAGPPSGPTPPGVESLPRPGEMYVSPALRELLQQDPVVQALFEGSKVAGTIGPEGLLSPHELRAVVGVDQDDAWYMAPLSGFDSDTDLSDSFQWQLNRIIAGFLVVLVAIPALALLVVSARLSAAERKARVASLRLLGMTGLGIRFVLAVETLLVALPAAVVSMLAFVAIRPHVSSIPGTQTGFFLADSQVGWPALVGVPLLVVAFCVGTAMLFGRVRERTVRPVLTGGRARRWSLVLVAAGYAGLFIMLLGLARVSGAPLLWVSLGLLAIGFPLSGPIIVHRLARALALRVRRGGLLVGLRSAAHDPGVSVRLASMLCLTIVAVGTVTPLVSILNGESGEDAAVAALNEVDAVPLVITRLQRTIEPDRIAGWEGVRAVRPILSIPVKSNYTDELNAIVADCPELERLSGISLGSCADGRPQWLQMWEGDPYWSETPASQDVRVGGTTITTPDRDAAFAVPSLGDMMHGSLLLPPDLLPDGDLERRANGWIVGVEPDPRLIEMTMARLTALDPIAPLYTGTYAEVDPGAARFPHHVRWLEIGSMICLGLGLLCLATATLGDTTARRRSARDLLVLGSSRTDVLAAHCGASTIPLLTLGLLASATAWSAGKIMYLTDDRAVVDAWFYPGLAIAAVVTALVVSVVTAPPLVRPLERDEVHT